MGCHGGRWPRPGTGFRAVGGIEWASASAAQAPAQGSCTTSDATGSYSLAVAADSGGVWLEATG